MKLSLNWIKDYVKIPDDMDLKQLAFDLTMSTVEVEGVEELARSFDGIVVGEIKEVLPHPNADKLRVCKVDIADGEIHDIVCGGSNLEVGMKVVVACPGAFVRWHGEGEPVEIKNAKLRGVPSFGMICAAVEVGLADLFPAAEEHEIMDVTSFDAPAGTPIAKALDLENKEDRIGRLEKYKVMLCIECGCCSYVCPANRPLVQNNRLAKGELREHRAHSSMLKK